MKLILCRQDKVGSYILRGYMGSRWSHSAIWDDATGTIYDSALVKQGGVAKHSEDEFFAHYAEFRVIGLDVKDLVAARAWLEAQLGKGYDWSALFGIFFRASNWEDDDKWFCSEMTETFRTIFDHRIFSERASRITPYHQDILA